MTEAEHVDELLRLKKVAVGQADWAEGDRPTIRQIAWPLAIDGLLIGARLIAKSPITVSPQEFCILLTYGRCVSRLDFEPRGQHRNPMDGPAALRRRVINGPHVHLWEHNRQNAKDGNIPADLAFAVPYQSSSLEFSTALEWFCNHHSIAMDIEKVPPLPWEPQFI